MDARRVRFFAALIVFVVWVASLAVLAKNSARRPAPRPAASIPIR